MSHTNPQIAPAERPIAGFGGATIEVVGNGRMGRALVASLRSSGANVLGPSGRGANAAEADVVLLCVPDREISRASAIVEPGRVVGHLSASAPLSLLEPHERFVMHPLISVTGATSRFDGAVSAVDGSTDNAIGVASAIAEQLGMRPRRIAAESRALYHAMASMASNYLVTVLGAAERLAGATGLERRDLEPLVEASVQNWLAAGARAAMTGPVVRGDDVTVARQRAAIVEAAPDLLPLWDALTTGTRELVRSNVKETE